MSVVSLPFQEFPEDLDNLDNSSPEASISPDPSPEVSSSSSADASSTIASGVAASKGSA